MKLKLFYDRAFLSSDVEPEPIFYPFLEGSSARSRLPGDSYYSGFDRYSEIAHSLFEISDLDEADLVIFPGNLEKAFFSADYRQRAIDLANRAKQAGKPTAGFFWGDCSDKELPVPCDLVFRNSLYRTTRTATDFAYPNWIIDFTKTHFDGAISIRQKVDKPVVGFCGFIGKSDLKFYAKRFLYQFRKLSGNGFPPPHYTGHLFRKKALSNLSKSSLVETNFILRNNMGFVGQAPDHYEAYYTAYLKNMQTSDYIFCCRGYGNYSFRFYEILACGRIPVFLDTDCVLPFDFEIDWKNYCVWLTPQQLPQIGEKIAEFHDKLSPGDFVALQYECRKLWEQKLSPEGFFANLHAHIAQLNRQSSKKER